MTLPPHAESRLSLDAACEITRTGDIWIFRGDSVADHAIRLLTNAPVNHVGMAVVLDDMPPLMWHAELGKGLLDVWTGTHQRGVQLHDLREAVVQWTDRYDQQAWMRQLDVTVTRQMEDELLRTIARMDGTPFPSTVRLAGRVIRGKARRQAGAEVAFCAEVVGAAYGAMGLVDPDRPANYYDPGVFWSGDDLELLRGASLGAEIRILRG